MLSYVTSPLSLSPFSSFVDPPPHQCLPHRGDHTDTYARMRLSEFEAAVTEDGATSDQEETSRLTDTEEKSERK